MTENPEISLHVRRPPSARAPIGASLLSAFFAITSPQAALAGGEADAADPFIGAFSGSVFGDNGTTGDIRVELAADPNDPTSLLASVSIGAGLEADLGRLCGTHQVPALEKSVVFARDGADTLFGETTWPLGRLTLDVDITATLLADVVSASIEVDTPAICPDVVMLAELSREVTTATISAAAE